VGVVLEIVELLGDPVFAEGSSRIFVGGQVWQGEECRRI
jgi:hypothetical protein